MDTALRALQNCGQIFRYAVATGRAERDPAADLCGALPPPVGDHFASITEPTKIGALVRSIDGYEGTHVARSALRLAPSCLRSIRKYLFPLSAVRRPTHVRHTLNAALRRFGYTTNDMAAHGLSQHSEHVAQWARLRRLTYVILTLAASMKCATKPIFAPLYLMGTWCTLWVGERVTGSDAMSDVIVQTGSLTNTMLCSGNSLGL